MYNFNNIGLQFKKIELKGTNGRKEKNNRDKSRKAGEVAYVVECLPSKCEGLISHLSSTKKEEKRKKWKEQLV
jgi:hypothetical protein